MDEKTQYRVLIVDDDLVDRELVRRAIGSTFAISHVTNCRAAIEESLAERPDCILLDHRLPDGEGVELLPEFVKQGIPVILMTGVGSESIAVAALKGGAQDYLSKEDFSPQLLEQCILNAIKNVKLKQQLARAELDRDRLRRAAEERNAVLDSVLQGVTEGIIASDITGKAVCINQTAIEILGHDAAITPISDWSEKYAIRAINGSKPIATTELPMMQAIRGMRVPRHEILVLVDGQPKRLSISGSPLQIAGETIGGVITFRDVTDESKRADDLRLLRNAIDSADESMLTVDSRGRIVDANVVAGTRCNQEREQLLMLHLDDIVVTRPDETWLKNYWPKLQSRGALSFEAEYLSVTGATASIEVSAAYVVHEGNEFALIFCRDIQERIRAAEEKKEMTENLLRVSHQAGMAEVATGVLHNIGNALNSVVVSAGTLRDKTAELPCDHLSRAAKLVNEHRDRLGEFVTQHPQGQHLPSFLTQVASKLVDEADGIQSELDSLVSGISHVASIVDSQQEFATRTVAKEKMPPDEVLRESIKLLSASLQKHGIDVELELIDQIPSVTLPRHDIVQILCNLLGNAKDAIVESGVSEGKIQCKLELVGGNLHYMVRDNGVGIEEEVRQKLFRHGFTTKPTGHGFGLHHSATIAQSLGGTIEAYSAGKGHGAVFTLTTPVSDPCLQVSS